MESIELKVLDSKLNAINEIRDHIRFIDTQLSAIETFFRDGEQFNDYSLVLCQGFTKEKALEEIDLLGANVIGIPPAFMGSSAVYNIYTKHVSITEEAITLALGNDYKLKSKLLDLISMEYKNRKSMLLYKLKNATDGL